MPDAHPQPRSRGRRSVGIALIGIAGLFIGPALLAQALQAWVVPQGVPPEALLPIALPLWLMQSAWWLFGSMAVIGLLLVARTPGSPRPAFFGGVVVVAWIATVVALHQQRALSLPWA